MKEYTIAKGWAIFLYLGATGLIVLFSWLMLQLCHSFSLSKPNSWLMVLAFAALLAIIITMILGIIDAYKGRLYVYNDKFIMIGALSRRELLSSEIKGYLINDQYIFLIPTDKDKKRIKISKYYSRYDEILVHISKRYDYLALSKRKTEKEDILNDITIGTTREERAQKFAKARKTVSILNKASWAAAAWAFFYPSPYLYAILANMAFPIIAILLIKHYKGLVRIDSVEGSSYPSAVNLLLIPSITILIRSTVDYDILGYSKILLPALLGMILLAVILLYRQKEFSFKSLNDILISAIVCLFLFGYSFASAIQYNCYFDNSEPEIYTVKVLEKRISGGKTTTRYFRVSPWGDQKSSEEYSVGKSMYNSVNVGEAITIEERKGKLGAPWIELIY